MPLYAPAISHGQTLGVLQLATNADGDQFADMQMLKFDWTGIKRAAIPVTNMYVQPTTINGNVGNMMFIPSAYVDPGQIRTQLLVNPTQKLFITDWQKIGPTSCQFFYGPAKSAQANYAGLGFIVAAEFDGPLDGTAMTVTLTIQLTDLVDNSYDSEGALAFTPAQNS